jgi:lipoprotein-anchoring transpeptidase ErfK/SrfK
VLFGAALTGCSASAGDGGLVADVRSSEEVSASAKPFSAARLTVNVPRRGPVQVDRLVEVTAERGTLEEVRVMAGKQRLPGELSRKRTRWTATERLEPGTSYELSGVAVDSDGLARKVHRTFRTADLTLDQQTYASVAPLDGETVGVGMPAILTFDIPVTDRAEVERHLSVDAEPAQPGTWSWISDTEVHWRPKSYWKPGTDVTVRADVNGVNAGNGIYGQEDRVSRFHVGDALVMNIDVADHTMRVVENGTLLRTIPISAGKPGFTTRSGIKLIVEKFRTKRMDAATTGIDEDDPEYYNLSNVEYAQRVTYSGEFIHAAPWSVGSQGHANVSHGCIGMSTENAGWLYSLTRRGDVVDVVGTDRPMESTNGYGDWNVSWADYRAGSALRAAMSRPSCRRRRPSTARRVRVPCTAVSEPP